MATPFHDRWPCQSEAYPASAMCRLRKGVLGRFEFLQAHDVRLFALEPFEQVRKSAADAVHVKRRDFHGFSDRKITTPCG